MANDLLRGRQTVASLTNKSGGAVAAGDVVILSSGTAAAFTTTTSAALATDWVGVAIETIANDASGRVCLLGYVPVISLSAAASLGDYVFTHTVAKQAAPNGTDGTGSFGQVLGTGTTPAAILWGRPTQAGGAGGGDVATDTIWDAAGDLVQGTGANTAARLAIGTAHQVLTVNAAATAAAWSTGGRVLIGEQTPTGTSASFTSIPGTYKALHLEWTARSDRSGQTVEALFVYFNNDTTATNYQRQRLSSSDTTVAAGKNDNADLVAITGATAPANSPGNGYLRVINYASTTFFKIANALSAYRTTEGTNNIWVTSLEWESTAAITRLDVVTANASNFVAGSTFRLYGET